MSLKTLPPYDPKGSPKPPLSSDEGENRLSSYSYTVGSTRSHLNSQDADDGFAYYWRILSQRMGSLFLAALLGALAAYLLTLPQTPVYRAQTLLEVQNLNEDFLNMRNVSPTATSALQSPEYNIRTQAAILQSRPVLERAINNLSVEYKRRLVPAKPAGEGFRWRKPLGLSEPESISDSERALQEAAAALRIQAEPNTRVIKVTFDSDEPKLAADFANSVADSFIQSSLETRWQTSQHTVDWLIGRMKDVKAKLKNSEDELQKFASAADLTFLSEKDNVADDRLKQLQADVSRAQADSVGKQARYELATSVPAESLPDVLDDVTLKDYHIELTALRRQLAELSTTFTETNPKVVKVQAQITTVETALEKKRSNIIARIRNEYESSRRLEKLLSANYAAQRGLMAKQVSKVSHYADLKREVDTTRQLYDSMFQKVTEAGLASAMRASSIQVIEKAIPPRAPYKPNILLNTAFGIVSAIFLAIAMIIQCARSDRGIKEPGDTAFLNVPELGVIPAGDAGHYRALRSLRKSGSLALAMKGTGPERLELTTYQRQLSAIAESFRLTLTSILFSGQKAARPRVLVLSSAIPREGKTTVISNLAIALAQADQRVLLVDGDMRRPRLHEIFEVENRVGLGDVLTGSSSLSVLETKIPHLFLLPSGHHDDAGLLFKPELRGLLRRLKSEFDMILIDTPPLLQMPDARLFARQADATILVVAQNTARDAVQTACQRLGEDGSVLLGTILNNWNPRHSRHLYTDYSDYYKAHRQNG